MPAPEPAHMTTENGSGQANGAPWYTRLAVIVTLLGVGAIVLWAYRKPLQGLFQHSAVAAVSETLPPSITVIRAGISSITEHVTVTGNLVAREEILVAPKIDGYAIDKILVEEGDRVSEGQLLAELSRSTIDTSLAQNEAQQARANASVALAQSTVAESEANKEQTGSALARSLALQKSGNATAETMDLREAADKMATARLAAVRHALTVAQAEKSLAIAQRAELMIRLEHTQIKAPAAGIISRRTARIGAVAAAAGEALFRIISAGDIEFEADVPETLLSRMKPGMKAWVTTAARKEPYTAHVRLLASEVNPLTRLGRVRIAIDAAPGLTVGAFGRAEVEVASRDGVIVPQTVVLYGEGGASVQVVKGRTVETRKVTLGLRNDRQVEIVQGLAAGDAVVATAGTFLRDGDTVRPVDPTAPGQMP